MPGLDVPAVVRRAVTDILRGRRAAHAASARGAGREPASVEEIVVEAWEARGLVPPKGLGLRAAVDLIVNPAGPTERLRYNARLAVDLVGMPLRLRRATRGGGLSRIVDRLGTEGGRVFEMAGDDEWVEVERSPGSTAVLGDIARQAVMLPSILRVTKAELRAGEAGDVEVWTHEAPGAHCDSRPIGTVSGAGAPRFARLVAIAERVDQPCVTTAVVSRRRDGRWGMYLARPITP